MEVFVMFPIDPTQPPQWGGVWTALLLKVSRWWIQGVILVLSLFYQKIKKPKHLSRLLHVISSVFQT